MKRSALIDRGYWIRVAAYRSLQRQFLAHSNATPVQVLSLGAGFDTSAFEFLSNKEFCDAQFVWFEIDLPDVVAQKSKVVLNNDELRALLFENNASDTNVDKDNRTASSAAVHSRRYRLLTADLRHREQVEAKLAAVGFDRSLPTLVVCYMHSMQF